MVTIRKIAEVAKVSRGTVDKVLNNRPGVSDEVRQRVMEIANALEYRPNIIGKALANQKKTVLIGVIIPPDSNPFFSDIKKGIHAAYQDLKDYNVKIDCQIMKDLDAQEQLNIIEYLVQKGISGLALNPIDDKLICEMINKLAESRIPVVTFTSDILASQRMCFVGQNVVKSGRVAGELMGKLLQGKGTVAIVSGSHNVLGHIQRIEGFKTVISEQFPGIQVLDTVENLDQDSISFEVTLALLEKYPDLCGLCLTSGGIGGAGKAIKLAGKNRTLKIISFDFVPETVELLKEGIIDFTIGQDPFTQGYKPIKILSDYLLFAKAPKTDFFQTVIDIRIKENININLGFN
jgi:LacI family transcriptional regulator